MAKKEKKEDKVILERVYNVPLRKEWLKKPKYKRAKKAVTALRSFVAKHMKSDNVKIGKYANLEIWKHGIRNPPHHIKVLCNKFEDGKVEVELETLPKKALEEIKEKEKLEKEGKKKEKKKESLEEPEEEEKKTPKSTVEKIENKVQEIKGKKQEEAKEIQKEELKELRKEKPKFHTPKEPLKPKEGQLRKTEQFVSRS